MEFKEWAAEEVDRLAAEVRRLSAEVQDAQAVLVKMLDRITALESRAGTPKAATRETA